MQYLMWRVMTDLNQEIEISFMLVGHTKFAPDWAFGLLKQKFRRTPVGCLDDLMKVVQQSASMNEAQLVGREDGTIIVKQYDWAKFFSAYFKRNAFDGIKSFHHLKFDAKKPGVVVVRKDTDGTETTLQVLKKSHRNWNPSPDIKLRQIVPPGLSRSTCMKKSGNLSQKTSRTLCTLIRTPLPDHYHINLPT